MRPPIRCKRLRRWARRAGHHAYRPEPPSLPWGYARRMDHLRIAHDRPDDGIGLHQGPFSGLRSARHGAVITGWLP